ncbi:MAG: amidohydrolase [Oscillospiraceae bacterium]|nr:amidohydrolase [Oscillospiraceae bacterium]
MEKYKSYVEKNRDLILAANDYIWKNPETGYREWKTHAYLEEEFAKLGYELTLAGDIPGFTAEADTGRPGPTVAVFGEMDGLIVRSHPDADPETGAVHACGHNAQCAALLGIAAALKEPGALDEMCGKIRLVAVPAEELIELEYRNELRKNGTITYFGGKPEFMRRGLLDGVDMAFMIHTTTSAPNTGSVSGGANGMIGKSVCYQGFSSHAASPSKGINAMYAANLGLNAINALRETFKDSDHIRVHPIITHGGDSVNAIPDTVKLESYVRGASMDAIMAVNKKINRAIAATAAAMGAKVQITDFPGYWVRKYDVTMMETMRDAMEQVLDEVKYKPDNWGTGCSDIGDVGAVMPTVHPFVGGATGVGHGDNYYIADPESACVKSAAVQLVFLAMLLKDDAAKAKQVIAEYEPQFASMEEYFAYADSINIDVQAVTYEENRAILTYGEV